MIDPDFFEGYLGMRVESVDEVEVLRRIDKKIYDEAEFEKAKAWVGRWCPTGFDKNPDGARKSEAELDRDWDFTIKCALVIKDLMNGNPELRQRDGTRSRSGTMPWRRDSRGSGSGRTCCRTPISRRRS